MQKIFKNISFYLRRTDGLLWFITILTSIYCLLLLKSVSRVPATDTAFSKQLFAIAVGYFGAVLVTLIDYRVITNYWKLIALVCLALFIITSIFAKSVTGENGIDARAWLRLPGGISFQASELAKIGFMITFSKHLAYLKEKNKLDSFLHILGLLGHALIPMGFTQALGDTGAAIIFFFMFLTMSFAAGVKLRYFVILLTSIIALLPFAWKYVLSDYQKLRILAIVDTTLDPFIVRYQQLQGEISIGSGQIFGRGLFKGPRVSAQFVPVQDSDLIFSVAGEELGFIGCMLILIILLILLIRVFQAALKSCDDLGSYICFGFFGMISSQIVFNLGMCLSLLPVMGVTLPFFSYGGTSISCMFLGIGLVQNVYMYKDDADTAALAM